MLRTLFFVCFTLAMQGVVQGQLPKCTVVIRPRNDRENKLPVLNLAELMLYDSNDEQIPNEQLTFLMTSQLDHYSPVQCNDGRFDTMCHARAQHEDPYPVLIVTYDCQLGLKRVEVHNRRDGDYKARINDFEIVFNQQPSLTKCNLPSFKFTNGMSFYNVESGCTPTTFGNCGVVGESCCSPAGGCSTTCTLTITATRGRSNLVATKPPILNVAEVKLYNSNGDRIPTSQLLFLQSSVGWGGQPGCCNNGNDNDFCHTNEELDPLPSLLVQFNCRQGLSQVEVANRDDHPHVTARLGDFRLDVNNPSSALVCKRSSYQFVRKQGIQTIATDCSVDAQAKCAATGSSAPSAGCSSGLQCSNQRCTACGQTGQRCCAGNSCSAPGLQCSSGVCSQPAAAPAPTCGTAGKPCCGANSCSSGLQCAASGSCVPNTRLLTQCGMIGQSCCTKNACLEGKSVCVGGACKSVGDAACGTAGAACCSGNTCTLGLNCRSGKCQQVSCGKALEMCCNGSQCGSGLNCMFGFCLQQAARC